MTRAQEIELEIAKLQNEYETERSVTRGDLQQFAHGLEKKFVRLEELLHQLSGKVEQFMQHAAQTGKRGE